MNSTVPTAVLHSEESVCYWSHCIPVVLHQKGAVFGDVFGYHSWRVVLIPSGQEAGDAAQQHTLHRAVPPSSINLGQNTSRAEAEKTCQTLKDENLFWYSFQCPYTFPPPPFKCVTQKLLCPLIWNQLEYKRLLVLRCS